jgi:hypothetical protein
MSQARLRLTQTGLRLENVIADERMYSGDMQVTPSNQLIVTSLVPGARVPGTAELNSRIASLEADVRQRDERIDRLNRQAATTGDAQTQELRRQVNTLENQVQQRNAEIARLQAASAARPARPDWETASSRLTRTLLSGLDRGTALTGQWQKTASSATQTDPARLNGKLVIPATQNSDELLYTFTGSASGTGWRGFGLHILGSGARSRDSYGFGQSYLVWMTRDPAHYQNPLTYIQVYRSFDDVHMVEMASRAVGVRIGTNNRVQVHVNRTSRTATVMLNGEAVFSFNDPDMIRSGDQVAVRALGQATVSGLEIKSR